MSSLSLSSSLSSSSSAKKHTRTPSTTFQSISISDTFDGGNVKLVDIMEDIGKNRRVILNVRRDEFTDLENKHHLQYFCFRVFINDLEILEETRDVEYVISNAGKTSFPVAWEGTTVCYTDNVMDTNSWRRNLKTIYQDGNLTWTHTHRGTGQVFFAYFPPFTYAQHLDLIAECQNSGKPCSTLLSLGQTLEGREIECITVGEGPRVCWIIARQHPGETMAEYYAEGLLRRLLGLNNNNDESTTLRDDDDDEAVQRALSLYTFHIVPCMNPDGAVAGFLRTNSGGANLNREWSNVENYIAPTLERSPEVLAVANRMDETGVDCFLDIHGDEELPYNFLCGTECSNNWGPRLQHLHSAFLGAYVRANSDMQKQVGYEPAQDASEALPNEAANCVANKFNCLSVTLEMPFKDCATNPDPERGWSPNRSRVLGASVIEPLLYVHPFLRDESEFWKDLPDDDRYVTPTSDFKKRGE